MAGSRIADVESALAASRAAADLRLVESLRQARQLETETAARGLDEGERRIAQLTAIRDWIAADAAQIDTSAKRLAQAMASASERLAEIDARADFDSAPWHSAIDETVARNLEPGV